MVNSQYSEKLKQNIHIDKEAGTITTDDGVVYNRQELKALTGYVDMIEINKIKKLFDGEVIG